VGAQLRSRSDGFEPGGLVRRSRPELDHLDAQDLSPVGLVAQGLSEHPLRLRTGWKELDRLVALIAYDRPEEHGPNALKEADSLDEAEHVEPIHPRRVETTSARDQIGGAVLSPEPIVPLLPIETVVAGATGDEVVSGAGSNPIGA
jgi:hypothetical protein